MLKLTIVTITYNSIEELIKTIDSVKTQSFNNYELLVIDGGSTDGTKNFLSQVKMTNLRYISEKDEGIYDAMNKGLKMAKGEWILFLNGGDTLYNKNTLNIIFSHNQLSSSNIIYGDYFVIGKKFKKLIKVGTVNSNSLKSQMKLCHQSFFVRKYLTEEYDISWQYKAEYDWIIKIFNKVHEDEVIYLNIPLVWYALGGFSERGQIKNIIELLYLHKQHFGIRQVFYNLPIYFFLFLRAIKNSFFIKFHIR